MTALEPADIPVAERICAGCAWSRNRAGELFVDDDRAFCAHPDVRSDDGLPTPCERQRFATSSMLLHMCGSDGIYFEPRESL